MAECPSQSYLDLVVTSGGLTPKDPYGWQSSNWDYAEWRVAAESIIAGMNRARDYLGSIEPSPFPEWERLRPYANDIWARFAALPEPWGFTEVFDVKKEVPKAINVAIEAACLWEQHDVAARALGGTPPARPSQVPGGKLEEEGGTGFDWKKLMNGTLILAGIIGGSVVLSKILTVKMQATAKKSNPATPGVALLALAATGGAAYSRHRNKLAGR